MREADWVFLGDVLTMDPNAPRARALAVTGDAVSAVGDEQAVRAWIGPSTRVVALDGRVLMPGFHDSHVHLTRHGFELSVFRLEDADSVSDVVERVRARAAELPPGNWVVGSGFALSRLGVQTIGQDEAALLADASPDHPVLLSSQDHHSVWVNRFALRLAGIDRDTPELGDRGVQRDAGGRPTGLLRERATRLVSGLLPEPGEDAIEAALSAAGADFASRGVTTVHHMAYEPPSYLRAMGRLAAGGDYPVRVWACVPQEDLEHALALGIAAGMGGPHFEVGGAKYFVDGALGSRTAWMLEPYAGGSDRGVEVLGPEALAERLPLAFQAGLAPAIHAIGDAANRAVLDALEVEEQRWRDGVTWGSGLRPRIEHAQHVHPDDVPRFGKLGVVASMQPVHLSFDADDIAALLPGREAHAYPIRSLLAGGAVVAFGSDTPVASPDVFLGLRAACRRRGSSGRVLGGAEALSPDQALAAYTTGAAAAIGRSNRSGMLRPGFDADFVLLSHDPLVSLNALAVHATFKAGRPTYGEGAL